MATPKKRTTPKTSAEQKPPTAQTRKPASTGRTGRSGRTITKPNGKAAVGRGTPDSPTATAVERVRREILQLRIAGVGIGALADRYDMHPGSVRRHIADALAYYGPPADEAHAMRTELTERHLAIIAARWQIAVNAPRSAGADRPYPLADAERAARTIQRSDEFIAKLWGVPPGVIRIEHDVTVRSDTDELAAMFAELDALNALNATAADTE